MGFIFFSYAARTLVIIMATVLNLLISTGAVLLGAYIIPGIEISGFAAALGTAVVLAIANAVLRPILLFFTLPVNFLTLGLFTLVVDAAIIMLVAAVVPGFRVKSFWAALAFSIILAVLNGVMGLLII